MPMFAASWPLATNSVELNYGPRQGCVFAAKIESIFAAICQLPRLFLTYEKIVAERKKKKKKKKKKNGEKK